MLTLPDILLWLFLLCYFVQGQISDITSLDTTKISSKESEDVVKATNHTHIYRNEEKKENKTAALSIRKENQKPDSIDTSQLSLSNITKVNLPLLSNISQEYIQTSSLDTLGRSHRRQITNQTVNGSHVVESPLMSQERRNSYLSIAERRKYYNKTRVQTKSQLSNLELDHQETTNKLGTSRENLKLNEIRVIKKPIEKEFSKELNINKNQTSNQVVFLSNETQAKPQSIRQSVIQSQYQFGQKLNLRKPVSRAQDTPEDRLKRKKEKIKIESILESNTNKLNKNYPTQSTKLIKVDKNFWATTTTPQVDDDNKNFVRRNGTILEKLVGYVRSGHSKIEAVSNKTAATSEDHNFSAEINQMKAFLASDQNPLPLKKSNVTRIGTLERNFNDKENISSVIHVVYSQEILKLNNMDSKTARAKENYVESSIKNFFNYSGIVNNSGSHSTTESFLSVFNTLTTVGSTTLLKVFSNTTGRLNFNASTSAKKENFSNGGVTQPTFSKSNLKEMTYQGHHTVTPMVKAISKGISNSTAKTRLTQIETNSNRQISERKEKSKSTPFTSGGTENWTKTEDYPLTIELNENNKRVLSEMFQTLTTPEPKKMINGEPTISQIHEGLKNNSFVENITLSTTEAIKVPTYLATTIQTISVTFTTNTTTNTTPSTESLQVISSEDYENEDYKAQGTQYNTKFYISPKFNETQLIKVVEEDNENDDVADTQSYSAGATIYVLAAFGLVPLLLALIFGARFMIQKNQRDYECELDAKSDISTNESQIKEKKKKKGSTDLKKSPSNVTTITLVTPARLPRVQHWETFEKQGNRNWEFSRSKLKLKTILGQGNFGQVWKAEAEDMPGHEGVTRLVAVKTVKEGATEKEHTEFLKELEIMQQVGSHPNIVTLLGCCTDQEPFYLIMEYVKYGKLLTYLREHRVNENYYNFSNNSDALTSRDLTVFAYCVARGMEYLASRGIIHRDLAARNVLVDHNKLCKIADFGMSRSVRDFENGQVYEERQQKGALPIRWMAPESLIYSVFTYKSDVWSFGIVMWEMVTLGSTPYPNMGAREVMRKVRDGYRLERPNHCKPEFYRLISDCWAHDPNKRPDFSELRQELSNLLDNPSKDGSYVDLDRFAVDNSFHVSSKTNDFRLLERNDFKTLQKIGDWENKDWSEDLKKIMKKKGRNDGKGTVTLTGQGSFTINSRILGKEFKII